MKTCEDAGNPSWMDGQYYYLVGDSEDTREILEDQFGELNNSEIINFLVDVDM